VALGGQEQTAGAGAGQETEKDFPFVIGHLTLVIEGGKETSSCINLQVGKRAALFASWVRSNAPPLNFDISNSLLTIKPPISSLN
jgi:hypothetical protein